MFYAEMSRPELAALKESLEREYAGIKAGDLDLDLSRGKPGSTQLNMLTGMLDCISTAEDVRSESGFDSVRVTVSSFTPTAYPKQSRCFPNCSASRSR